MSDYEHGNWFCRPANEAEAKEIIERAVASGANNRHGYFGKSNSTDFPYGVINGRIEFGTWKGRRYTIEQVREKFPLPGEQEQWDGEGLPPTGVECVVFHQGRWIRATTVGEFGYQKKCMVCAPRGGGFYGFYADEIRPLCTERERWVEDAISAAGGKQAVISTENVFGKIYDALKSGDLKAPEVE